MWVEITLRSGPFSEAEGKGLPRLREAGDGARHLLFRIVHRKARGLGHREVRAEQAEDNLPQADKGLGKSSHLIAHTYEKKVAYFF